MQTIGIKISDGLMFDENDRLTISIDEESNISKLDTGLYVSDFENEDIITPASYSMKNEKALNKQLIFSMCTYHITDRTGTLISTDNTLKSVQDIVDEINYPIDNDMDCCSSYCMTKGDLFQLTDKTHGRTDVGTPFEDGKRYQNDRVLALFYVDSISYHEYNDNKIKSLTIRCIWRDDDLSDIYSVGKYYSNFN